MPNLAPFFYNQAPYIRQKVRLIAPPHHRAIENPVYGAYTVHLFDIGITKIIPSNRSPIGNAFDLIIESLKKKIKKGASNWNQKDLDITGINYKL